MRRGFTLIEMTVVLLIIGIVTHLAMRQLGALLDDRKTAAANRQLEEVRESVFCFDREGVPSGFLADMGRLVTATNGTLAELWRMPAGAKPYAVIPATKANMVAGAEALANTNVFVATGWRGPYLRLPIGKSRLMDPWGNPLENPDAAGYRRIETNGAFAVGLSHFGPTALQNDPRRQKSPLTPAGGAGSRIFVQLVSRANDVSETATVDYTWYGPASGKITGGKATLQPYGTVAELDGLTPGPRVILVEWTPAGGSKKSLTRLVKVRPGDNQLEIEVP